MKRTMPKRFAVVINVFSKLIVCIMFLWLVGCKSSWSQPGETVAEGHRRHLRNVSVNQQTLSGDIDRALLADKPSTAQPLRVPPSTEPQDK